MHPQSARRPVVAVACLRAHPWTCFKAFVGLRVSLVAKEFEVERVQGLMGLKGRLESSCMCACLTGAYGGLGSEYRYHTLGVFVGKMLG